MPSYEFIDVVDDADTVIGRSTAQDAYTRGLNHRVVHIFILNDQNDIALQKRRAGIDYAPNCWSASATGHVLNNETYRQAAQRITKTHLGITPELKFSGKLAYRDPKGYTKYLGVFAAAHNGPFRINANDIETINFFSRNAIEEMSDSGAPLQPELIFILRS